MTCLFMSSVSKDRVRMVEATINFRSIEDALWSNKSWPELHVALRRQRAYC